MTMSRSAVLALVVSLSFLTWAADVDAASPALPASSNVPNMPDRRWMAASAVRGAASLLDYVADSDAARQIASGTFAGDATPFLQAAMDACAGTATSPASLLIPRGIYRTSGFINRAGSDHCAISAEGATFIKTSGTDAAVLSLYGNDVTLEGGFFDAAGLGPVYTPAVGVRGSGDRLRHVKAARAQGHDFYFLNAQDPSGEDLEAFGSVTGAGIDLSGVTGGRFTQLKAYGNAKEGVALDNITTYTVVNGVEVYGNGTIGALGGVGSGASGNYNDLSNIFTHDNHAWGMGLQGLHARISHVTSQNNSFGGVYFEGADPTNHPVAGHEGDIGYDLLLDSSILEAVPVKIDADVPGIVVANVDHPNGDLKDLSRRATILGGPSTLVFSEGPGGGAASNIVAAGPNASFGWYSARQSADAKSWDTLLDGTTLRFRAVNDTNTAANVWLDVQKNGFAPTLAKFYVPLFSPSFIESLSTPASSKAPCTPGQFTDDANYHYVCVAINTWKRAALSAF